MFIFPYISSVHLNYNEIIIIDNICSILASINILCVYDVYIYIILLDENVLGNLVFRGIGRHLSIAY